MIRFFSLILLVGLLTLLQAFGFSLFNIKPNLALLVIIAASFFLNNFWERFLLVALAVLILKFSPGFTKEILFFFLIGATAVMVKDYLPWNTFLSNLILITLATFIFYLLLAPSLILSNIFIKELFLNLILGSLIFALFKNLWQNRY